MTTLLGKIRNRQDGETGRKCGRGWQGTKPPGCTRGTGKSQGSKNAGKKTRKLTARQQAVRDPNTGDKALAKKMISKENGLSFAASRKLSPKSSPIYAVSKREQEVAQGILNSYRKKKDVKSKKDADRKAAANSKRINTAYKKSAFKSTLNKQEYTEIAGMAKPTGNAFEKIRLAVQFEVLGKPSSPKR